MVEKISSKFIKILDNNRIGIIGIIYRKFIKKFKFVLIGLAITCSDGMSDIYFFVCYYELCISLFARPFFR